MVCRQQSMPKVLHKKDPNYFGSFIRLRRFALISNLNSVVTTLHGASMKSKIPERADANASKDIGNPICFNSTV